MTTESAYPDRLLSYASSARADSTALAGAGSKLSTAIEAFIATHPDPQVISGVTDWGQELTAYARQKSQIDQWVHDVGVRFQAADGGNLSSRVTITDGFTPTISQVLAQRNLDSQQKKLQEAQDCTAPGNVGPLGYVPFPSTPDTGPRAEALPPGAREQALKRREAWQEFLRWVSEGGDPHDPEEPQWLVPPPEEVPLWPPYPNANEIDP